MLLSSSISWSINSIASEYEICNKFNYTIIFLSCKSLQVDVSYSQDGTEDLTSKPVWYTSEFVIKTLILIKPL